MRRQVVLPGLGLQTSGLSDVKRVGMYENQQQNTQSRFTNMKRLLVRKD